MRRLQFYREGSAVPRRLGRAGCVVLCLMAIVGSLAGLSGSARAGAPDPPEGARLLFADDFTEDAPGQLPSRWVARGKYLRVVEDPSAPGGRAVQMIGDPEADSSFRVEFAADASTVVVQHALRWVKGTGINYYLNDAAGTDHNVNWLVDGQSGALAYRFTEGGRTRTQSVGRLRDGWNTVRIVADAKQNAVLVYLNDLDQPAAGPLPFRTPIDGDWKRARLIFADAGRRDKASLGESYYADVRVWALDGHALAGGIAASDLGTPVEIEYHEVAAKAPDWWRSAEAVRLAARMARSIHSPEVIIGIPLGQLSVPDGILPTQLLVMAHMYAVHRDEAYKRAFATGLEKLLQAQYPSGGWPTIFPRYQNRDLHGDTYAGSTWKEIPALFDAILQKSPPFDGDLLSEEDRTAVQAALARIPPQDAINRFLYSAYSGRSAEWWSSEEAIRIADNLLSWQVPAGGWWENVAMHVLPFDPERMVRSLSTSGTTERGTFDDHGTIDPMRFLARVYEATQIERFKESFYRGLDFILAAQYPSGGWPQSFPDPPGYSAYVTFNDQAMINILRLIQEIIDRRPPFGFVEEDYVERLRAALEKGIDYILKAQIEVDGRLTAWGQQHDPVTYEPRSARVFEPVAITGAESVPIVEFLLTLPDPSEAVRRAVLSALEWFEAARLPDGRWARFYEIGTGRPIFAGRDGVVRYNLSEIDLERQLNYAWYGTWPASLLARARSQGLIDKLYESLPDHPSVRVRFRSPRDGARVSGTVPLDVALIHPEKAAFLRAVTVSAGDTVIYEGRSLPDPGAVQLDTRRLGDGRHALTVTMVHERFGAFSQSIEFHVRNTWTMVQNMAPPLSGGWFGEVDFLQTADRSDGWGYATGESSSFFGDAQRLVRTSDASQYLIWETPNVTKMQLTAYVGPGVALEDGVTLAVSREGEVWHELPYVAQYESRDSTPWRRAVVTVTFAEAADMWNWFRLVFSDSLSKEDVQIGEVVFEGYLAD